MGNVVRTSPLPAVTLALVVHIGTQQELLPIYDRDLLADAAVSALRTAVEEACRSRDPEKTEEAALLANLLSRMIPEIRPVIESALISTSEVIQ
jgi:hypothetical protein